MTTGRINQVAIPSFQLTRQRGPEIVTRHSLWRTPAVLPPVPPACVLCPTRCAGTGTRVRSRLPRRDKTPTEAAESRHSAPPPRSGWPCIRPPRRRPKPVRRGRPRRSTTNPQVPFATAIGASRFNPPRGTRLNSAHLVHGSGPYRPPDPRGPPVPPSFRSGPDSPLLSSRGRPSFSHPKLPLSPVVVRRLCGVVMPASSPARPRPHTVRPSSFLHPVPNGGPACWVALPTVPGGSAGLFAGQHCDVQFYAGAG
jgi:hypothetical protein